MHLLGIYDSPSYEYLIFEFCPLGTVKQHIKMNAGYKPNEIAYIVK